MRTETILKIYNILVLPTFLYMSENWTLTALQRRRINWSYRNEVIETSGRLYPSWPQKKRLRTPWTTDWRHIKQDRWIQKELAFTLAKNASKPNPFEIISQQTTRKENNWKNEETLARAVVTLETERIKGSNPWCLWWWWWWWWWCTVSSKQNNVHLVTWGWPEAKAETCRHINKTNKQTNTSCVVTYK
jgi:hypothetical protein